VEDTFGMMTVVAILYHSLNAGVKEATVQLNTIQKRLLQFQMMKEPLPARTGLLRWLDTRKGRGWVL
jgi:hypothetical protein